VAGGEHAAERGEHDAEALVVVRQRLRVALDPFDRDPGLIRSPAGVLEQLWGQVEPDHAPTRDRRRDRRIPCAAGHVEDGVTGAHADAVDEVGADAPDVVDDRVVVARGPGGSGALLRVVERHARSSLSTGIRRSPVQRR
jgi:hypothetical protein